MGRQHRNSPKQGPDSERLWRRLTSLFKSDDEWNKHWSADEFVDFLIEHEARPPSREDAKAYRKRMLGDVQDLIDRLGNAASTSSGKETTPYLHEHRNPSLRLNKRSQIGLLGYHVLRMNHSLIPMGGEMSLKRGNV